MTGSKVTNPPITQEEKDLLASQTELLGLQADTISDQNRIANLILPALLQSSGFDITLDEFGAITGIEQDPELAELQDKILKGEATLQELQLQVGTEQLEAFRQQQPLLNELFATELDVLKQRLDQEAVPDEIIDLRQDVEEAFLQRTLSALEGELDLPAGLERDLSEQRGDLENQLRDQLGPDFATSSPGIEALAQFDEREVIIKDAARRGEITGLQAFNLQSQSLENQSLATIFGATPGRANEIAFAGAGADTFARTAGAQGFNLSSLNTAGAFGGAAAGFSAPLSTLFNNRQLEASIAQFNASQSNALSSAVGGFVGKTLGTVAGSFIGSKFGKPGG